MRKINKPLKGLSFRKQTECYLSDNETMVYLRTLSIGEENTIKLNIPYNIPTKIGALTEVEKQELALLDPKFNKNAYPAIKTYDRTSIEWAEYTDAQTKYNPILQSIKYIDFDAELETGETLWQNIGVVKGDWYSACRWFEEAGFSDLDAERIQLSINRLKGDGVFGRIYKLQQITQMDYMDLLTSLDEIVERKKNAEDSVNQAILDAKDQLFDRIAEVNSETFQKENVEVAENTPTEGTKVEGV